MSVINAIPLLLGDDGYQISRSVRLRSSASAYFNRTPGSTSNRRTWTWSGWVKRGTLSAAQALFSAWDGSAGQQGGIQFESGNILQVYTGGNSGSRGDAYTTAVFRDASASYHVVVVMDTTLATATDRIKIFINGVQQTVTFTAQPPQNTDGQINANIAHRLGSFSGSNYFDGYLTEVNFIDGQALTPSSFGETDAITGVWKPKKYTGTYGTNGFFLNFSDNSAATAAAIGKDYSGNGNNWTPNNVSVTAGATYDSMLDVPTPWGDRGNYAVLNPLNAVAQATIADGNLGISSTTPATWKAGISTIQLPASGKWYFESTIGSGGVGTGVEIGLVSYDQATYRTYKSTGTKNSNGGGAVSYGSSYGASAVIGVAIDSDAGTIAFYNNNTAQGTAFTDVTSAAPASGWYLAFQVNNSSGHSVNFGQRPFTYTPPTGFKALNTQNLPDPTIKKGNQYFDATTYTGNGGTLAVVNSGAMQPDFVWLKGRSLSNHRLFDAVRGAGTALVTNNAGGEATDTTTLTAFNSNGFALGACTSFGTTDFNANGSTYVGWQWKEGATPGFDVVTYTGTGANRTVAHSLGVAPKLGFFKRRDSTSNWSVYYNIDGFGAGVRYLQLNSTGASTYDTTYWNSTVATSSVFSLGTAGDINTNAGTYVAYLFSEVAGFSKFGSYTGNGSADGPFVFCGFRPRYVMAKRTDSTSDWFIHDTARDASNLSERNLYAQLSNAEDTLAAGNMDLLSNGFKLRTPSNGNPNVSGGTYIFMAFAENPFKYALAR